MRKPIAGSTDWQLRSVTLDVPEDASTVNFGVIEAGTGQVWIDQLMVAAESVGKLPPPCWRCRCGSPRTTRARHAWRSCRRRRWPPN